MGSFYVPIAIGDWQRESWTTQEALVDAGAFISAVPGSLLRELGVQPMMTRTVRFAQGQVRELPIGQTWMRLQGQEIVSQVAFNEEGTTPLLGALTLEEFFVAVDPVDQRLVPIENIMM